ncbi:OsmC family protein [Geothrix sp. 21YS21S-4]|uniref:OsmC family protein n=1 Tax=Geothrix sp. 21YS21S-4 TaxID=3068889 RepID=UPI0027B9DCDB|nr:OsmC family protein [Geothrix sp. 21YS21S-4]
MGNLATIRNGVNVEELEAMRARVEQEPAGAQFTFRSRVKWINRAHSQSAFGSVYGWGEEHARPVPLFLEGDEPAVLLGTDLAPTPREAALHALGACLSATYAYAAAAMGIDIASLGFDLETDADLRGFFETDPSVGPGLSQIRIKVNLACSGTPEEVEELHARAARTSPLLDAFRNPVDVRIET